MEAGKRKCKKCITLWTSHSFTSQSNGCSKMAVHICIADPFTTHLNGTYNLVFCNIITTNLENMMLQPTNPDSVSTPTSSTNRDNFLHPKSDALLRLAHGSDLTLYFSNFDYWQTSSSSTLGSWWSRQIFQTGSNVSALFYQVTHGLPFHYMSLSNSHVHSCIIYIDLYQ